MGLKIMRVFSVLFWGLIGYYAGIYYCFKLAIIPAELRYTNVFGIIAAFAMIGYMLGPFFYRQSTYLNKFLEDIIQKLTPQIILAGVFGLIGGLLFANLLFLPLMIFAANKEIFLPLIIFFNISFSYIGLFFSIKSNLFSKYREKVKSTNKILDTSVIIDGRIADICKAGFIEGDLIIPQFVAQELRHIADSPDSLRRNRGRRGLDSLKKMQIDLNLPIKFYEGDFPEIREVDDKLIKLAKVMEGTIITNDYNLNKSASLEGIKILNINELANALKPEVLPGEEMEVRLIKEGKEDEQAVAYLDDGTMIVVEEGKKYIGETIKVVITNLLQTPAGKVIFAKLRE